MSDPLLIAFTGSWGSGCTTASKYLCRKQKGKYFKISLSDKLKRKYRNLIKGELDIKKDLGGSFLNKYGEGKKINRRAIVKKVKNKYESGPAGKKEVLQDLGNALRELHGPEYLVANLKRVIDRELKNKKTVLVDQVKNLGEHNFLKENFYRYYLININARYEVRHRRLPNVNEQDFSDLDERDASEKLTDYKTDDKGNGFFFGQEVSKCVDAADVVILNKGEGDAAEQEFFKKIEKRIGLLTSPVGIRPPRDNELFMTVARVVSLFSHCLKRKVGTVIIKGSNIISSGYNDVPSRIKNCYEAHGRCFRLKMEDRFKPVGFKKGKAPTNPRVKKELEYSYKKHLDFCRGIHAEERAILKAQFLNPEEGDCVLYTTLFPCQLCAKKIVEIGIKEVVFCDPYPYREAKTMLEDAGVKLTEFEGVKAKAYFKLYGSLES